MSGVRVEISGAVGWVTLDRPEQRNALDLDARLELADVFRTTQSLVALRWGESTARPLALVRPGLVRVRNVREFAWPPDTVVQKWARVRPPTSLERTTLTDDRRRILLVAKVDGPRTYQKRLGLS